MTDIHELLSLSRCLWVFQLGSYSDKVISIVATVVKCVFCLKLYFPQIIASLGEIFFLWVIFVVVVVVVVAVVVVASVGISGRTLFHLHHT